MESVKYWTILDIVKYTITTLLALGLLICVWLWLYGCDPITPGATGVDRAACDVVREICDVEPWDDVEIETVADTVTETKDCKRKDCVEFRRLSADATPWDNTPIHSYECPLCPDRLNEPAYKTMDRTNIVYERWGGHVWESEHPRANCDLEHVSIDTP